MRKRYPKRESKPDCFICGMKLKDSDRTKPDGYCKECRNIEASKRRIRSLSDEELVDRYRKHYRYYVLYKNTLAERKNA